MSKLLALILACLAFGPVAAGCGGDDDSGDGGGGGGGDSGGGAAADGTEVSMEDIQFKPKDLTVAPGDTITFTNNESLAHDVHKTSGPGKDFASGPSGGMKEGATYELTLEQPGKYEYVCEIHAPGMTGTITVK